MMQNNSFNSTDSDTFYVERSATELSAGEGKTLEILNSTELSGPLATEHITLSSVASPQPQLITIQPKSNESTIPYGYGRQDPVVPPS